MIHLSLSNSAGRQTAMVIIALALLALTAGLSIARAGGDGQIAGGVEEKFAELDKDHDGKLSPQEFPKANIFATIDTSGDGFITLDELKAYLAKPQTGDTAKKPGATPTIEEKFRQLDKDGNGSLSPQEFPKPEAFKVIDADGNGAITLEEMKAYFTAQATAHKPEGKGDPSIDQRYIQWDKNGDGKLSRDEFPKPELFTKADTNGDGFVTLDELKAILAQSGGKIPPTPEEQFARLDKNRDGKISPQEFPKPEVFTAADTDKSGFLSLDELKALLAKGQQGATLTPEERFARMDTDGNGKLSPQEFPKPEAFTKADANGDGQVTLDEFKTLFAQQAPKPGTGKPMPTVEERFARMDANGDGKLSPQEFSKPEAFAKADANGDGQVTLDEFKTLFAQQAPKKP